MVEGVGEVVLERRAEQGGNRQCAVEVLAEGRAQQHFRIEEFVGVIVDQYPRQLLGRDAVGERCRDQAAGTDADENVGMVEVEAVDRFGKRHAGADFVDAADRTAAGQGNADFGHDRYPRI